LKLTSLAASLVISGVAMDRKIEFPTPNMMHYWSEAGIIVIPASWEDGCQVVLIPSGRGAQAQPAKEIQDLLKEYCAAHSCEIRSRLVPNPSNGDSCTVPFLALRDWLWRDRGRLVAAAVRLTCAGTFLHFGAVSQLKTYGPGLSDEGSIRYWRRAENLHDVRKARMWDRTVSDRFFELDRVRPAWLVFYACFVLLLGWAKQRGWSRTARLGIFVPLLLLSLAHIGACLPAALAWD
jgi:hypothetical protein